MKVVFVYPSYESLGLELVSAMLKTRGHETQLVFDPCLFDDTFLQVKTLNRLFQNTEHVVQEVVEARPDVVAFSAVTDTFRWCVLMAEAIKRRIDVPVVMGGIHITSVGEVALEEPSIDFIIKGEGEHPMVELVEALEAGHGIEQVPNVGYRVGGKAVVNPIRPLLTDLDSLPFPDKSLYDHTPVNAHYVYTTTASRGCRYSCSFCNNNMLRREYRGLGKYLRRRTPRNVIDELLSARRVYDYQAVNFYDEIFSDDREWLLEFCDLYEKHIRVPYICCVHPLEVREHVADRMAASGCVKVDLGVQSNDEEVRKRVIFRKEDDQDVARTVKVLQDRGISVHCENIFGLPGQTEEQIIRAAEFYNEVRPSVLKVYWLRYYPRTGIVKVAQEHGLLTEEEIHQLDRGHGSKSFATGGSVTVSPTFKKLNLFFMLILHLPRGLVAWVLRHRLYRWLPTWGVAHFSTIIMRMLNQQEDREYEFMKYRYTSQYRYYVYEWIKAKVNWWSRAPRPVEQ